MKAVELGCPGHLCVARSCVWRRHTQIGDRYRVSTVGDYFPRNSRQRETVGSGDDEFFETMVFDTFAAPDGENEGCGCKALRSLSAVDQVRYATAGEAQAGHERLVRKYLARAKKEKE